MLNILTIPKDEKKLRQKSKPVVIDQIKSSQMQKFFDNLSQTMFSVDGIGLAAPQVDQPIRAIAINLGQTAQIMINPQITKKSWSKDILEEGCLSVPNVYDKVKRHKKIKLEYYDKQSKPHTTKFKNMLARVIQHEIDHLDGILFIDKLIK